MPRPKKPGDLAIRCSCGALRGAVRRVSPAVGNRIVCYCDDCQSFPHFLGRADEILDAHGGTDIFQTSPARVEIREGIEHLACMRLTPKGLVRWYADCCKTPIGNTLATGAVPFVGLIRTRTLPGEGRDDLLGPVRGGVMARFAKGDRSTLDAHDRFALSLFLRFARIALAARLRGDHRKGPFFDPKTQELRVTPRVLEPEELRDVERRRDAA
jgi:hypothetical protein